MKYFKILGALLLLTSCASHYHMTGIERTRMLIDKRYDAQPVAEAQAFIAPYQHEVDSIMSPVVGTIAKYMAARKPESELSNLMSDILVWGGTKYNEQPDFAIYNVGGIRAGFAAGKVTFGNVVDVAPFENKICFLTLTGAKVLELFSQLASRGGEGVSRGVELRIADGKLISARLHGKDIDPQANYRIATLDYLAQGKDGTNLVSPQTEENNVRFIIMDYFRAEAAEGRIVDANIEGRIISETSTDGIPLGN